MIIPPNELSQEALQGLLESYISHEGTDYGEYEYSLEEKLNQLKPQVLSGRVLIVYDAFSESFNLINKEDYDSRSDHD